MTPEQFRLEQVAARLIERLEGTRRSYPDPAAAKAELERVVDEMASAAASELAGSAADHADRRAAFLRRELHSTFLPRYAALATGMTAAEARGHGFGALASPVGRIGLIGAALGLAYLDARFLFAERVGFLFLPLLALIPLTPDMGAFVARRRYRNDLQAIVDDLAKVQTESEPMLAADDGALDRELASPLKKPTPRRQPESQ